MKLRHFDSRAVVRYVFINVEAKNVQHNFVMRNFKMDLHENVASFQKEFQGRSDDLLIRQTTAYTFLPGDLAAIPIS